MSFSDSRSFNHAYFPADMTPRVAKDGTRSSGSAEPSLDDALRSVPLPEGLLARLRKLVFTMSDERTDRMDYLGC
jgi:hypothetical protein